MIGAMRAMVLDATGEALAEREVADPEPGDGEVLVRVEACGVCRTDLHVVDGELPDPKLPVIPGHQVVGEVIDTGERVGIPWLGWTCGECRYCRSGRENLCVRALFNGYTRDGGYAELATVDHRYAFPLPEGEAAQARPAPLRRTDRLPRASLLRRCRAARASTASAPRRTSSARWRAIRAGGSSR